MRKSSSINAILTCCLVIILVFSLFVTNSFANTKVAGYHDLTNSHWAYSSIMTLTDKELVQGKSALDENGYGYFGPEDPMTIAEFVTVLARYTHPSGITAHDASVDSEIIIPWYYDYYLTAINDGYILSDEYTIDNFNSPITRQEMALILKRAVEYSGETLDETVPNHMVPDISTADEKYRQSILKLYHAGILNGMDHLGNYQPYSTVTRAQATVILHRLISPEMRIQLPLDMRYIVHAAGEIDGYKLTNSMDALENSYQMGNRFIEIDFSYSSDMYHVCIHDWNNVLYPDYLSAEAPPTKDQFLQNKIYDIFRSMWIDDVADFMRKHPDLYIITDSKDDNIHLARYIAEKHSNLKDRFIIQIYSQDQYDPIASLGFDKIIFTLYNLSWEEQIDTASIINFARSHKLTGITFPKELAYMGGYPKTLHASGVKLYVHTEDDPAKWQTLFDLGISGVYTNRPPHVS